MRRILVSAALLLAVGAFLVFTLGASGGGGDPTYKIELDNAFGLVNGADFKVAGVIAGSIKSIDLCYQNRSAHCQNPLHAVITVQASEKGFGQFHSDAYCQSRPQSLIGEYYVDCAPGTASKVLPPGSTIPASQTQSTIPADLVQNIMRLPYRQRFSLLINELGAAVASRSEDLQTALRRADPALAQTDNLLALLANDAHTIRDLNANADSVITALAQNSKKVQQFVIEANRASTESATQAPSITATWNKLPGFLAQLRPALAKLGAASDAQDAVFTNLNAASANLHRFFTDLVPFSNESVPSLRSLGQASVVGKPAVQAAGPTVSKLNQFARPTPELAQNLAIVLGWLDNRKYAAEPDPRSPGGGAGYTGLESLLMYVFNVTDSIDYFGPWGHMLGVDAFANSTCSPYATPATIASNIQSYVKGGGDLTANNPSNPRTCYAFLGPNQPGVNEPDPTWNAKDATPANPSPCVPDPGGYPIQGYGVTYYGPKTNACKLNPSSGPAPDKRSSQAAPAPAAPALSTGGGSPGKPGSVPPAAANVQQTLSKILSGLGIGGTAPARLPGVAGATADGAGSPPPASQAQQLLNYLLSP